MPPLVCRSCIRCVAERHSAPAPTIYLENSSRRHSSDNRYVVGGSGICVVQAVEASSNVGESENSDQSCIHPIAFNRGKSRVLRSDLTTVEKLKSPGLQRVPL